MDEATRDFFRRQLEDPDNQVCVDCGTANPQWASVSHGCYISLESSGVHRSLGVHISFVRSTTMDSWKPVQLKAMELGGNQKLKAFFRLHNIPDDMPITQKYHTRAAEWYRRNLRALAEGAEPLPPLEEGTGHLPSDSAPSTTSFARVSTSGMMSAGGAFASDARHYSAGYHARGDSESSSGSSCTSPTMRRPMDGFGSDGLARPSRRPMDGFGSDGHALGSRSLGEPGSESRGQEGREDGLLSGFLGPEVGSKVSTGVWSAVGLVGSFASKAKSIAETRVQQAQQEGWMDSAFDAAKQGLGAVVEAGKATYTYVNDNGSQAVIGKTAEALNTTAKKSMSLVGSGADWFSEQISTLGQDNSTAAGLQALSSGRMEGFGPDNLPLPTVQQTEAAASSGPRMRHHFAPTPKVLPRKPHVDSPDDAMVAAELPRHGSESSPGVAQAPPPGSVSAAVQGPPGKPVKAALDVWNDDEWGPSENTSGSAAEVINQW